MTNSTSPDTKEGVSGNSPSTVAVIAPLALNFDALYAANFAFVWRSLRLLGVCPASLEDAAQESFAIVARKLSEYSGDAQLTTWIFAIVRRVAANQRRTQRRKLSQLRHVDEPLACESPNPEAQAQASQAAALVEQFCLQLEPQRKEVFVLALLEGVPPGEVAEALGLPVNTVYSRIRLLRASLRSYLAQQEEVTSVRAG